MVSQNCVSFFLFFFFFPGAEARVNWLKDENWKVQLFALYSQPVCYTGWRQHVRGRALLLRQSERLQVKKKKNQILTPLLAI